MTIDEAIKRYADNAEYERTHGNLQGCLEFKQLVMWLKELRAYQNIVGVLEKVNVRDIEDEALPQAESEDKE